MKEAREDRDFAANWSDERPKESKAKKVEDDEDIDVGAKMEEIKKNKAISLAKAAEKAEVDKKAGIF